MFVTCKKIAKKFLLGKLGDYFRSGVSSDTSARVSRSCIEVVHFSAVLTAVNDASCLAKLWPNSCGTFMAIQVLIGL
jgi:hypothetical protein